MEVKTKVVPEPPKFRKYTCEGLTRPSKYSVQVLFVSTKYLMECMLGISRHVVLMLDVKDIWL